MIDTKDVLEKLPGISEEEAKLLVEALCQELEGERRAHELHFRVSEELGKDLRDATYLLQLEKERSEFWRKEYEDEMKQLGLRFQHDETVLFHGELWHLLYQTDSGGWKAYLLEDPSVTDVLHTDLCRKLSEKDWEKIRNDQKVE